MPECFLIVDNRERIVAHNGVRLPLVVHMKNLRNWQKGQLGVAQLPLGDMVFMQGEQIRAVYERKTASDFVTSTGKRIEQQKSRLIQAKFEAPGTVYGVIVEGIFTEEALGKHNATHIQNLIWDLSKYDLVTIRTRDLEETCDYLCYMRHSYSQEPDMDAAQKTVLLNMSNYSGKKKDVGPGEMFAQTLKLIMGVSGKHAKAIADKYDTLDNLILEMVDEPRILEGLRIDEKRKIGKSLSTKIYRRLFGMIDD